MANVPTDAGDATDGPVQVDSVGAFEVLVASSSPVLVDFDADWCGPCEITAPTVEELATEAAATVATVDVEATASIAARYDVQTIPAFVVFEDGTPADRLAAMHELSHHRAAIDQCGAIAYLHARAAGATESATKPLSRRPGNYLVTR